MRAKRVLLLEREPEERFTLSFTLEEEGYGVAKAESSREALALLADGAGRAAAVDAVIIDLETLADAEEGDLGELEQKCGRTPCIALLGFGDDRQSMRFKKNGHVTCLEKPFAPDDLVSLLERRIGGGRARGRRAAGD
ncbi:MAG: response regulator [Kiritimatiellae bacterium]|nr:response regulator [Kiritimatiellia bacterium]